MRVVEIVPGLEVREDGMVRHVNTSSKAVNAKEDWHLGNLCTHGYRRVYKKGVTYKVHRLVASAFISNSENKPMVDHVDGDRQNNDISNLRWVSRSENGQNHRKHREGKIPGVHTTKGGKYEARTTYRGSSKYLGVYNTPEEAHAAYVKFIAEVSK